jgi:nucleotide-binding universal stress UspA family protein
MKVLLAVDDSKFSEAAIETVMRQMRPEQTEVCVLHVVEPLLLIPYYYMGQVASLETAQEKRLAEGKELVARAAQRLTPAGYHVQTDVKEGDPRAMILDYAEAWNPDLIVVGSHGRKGLDRFLIGSVAESVARHAACSVLVVRLR